MIGNDNTMIKREQRRGWLYNSRIPPQLEKNDVVPPSSKDEALARYSVSREVPRSVLKSEKFQ